MEQLSNFKISNENNDQKLNINSLNIRSIPILAGNEILKIHHYFKNKISHFCKTKTNNLPSPFSLFNPKSPLLNFIKMTFPTPSELIDKISTIGHKNNTENPPLFTASGTISEGGNSLLQDFICSVLPKNSVATVDKAVVKKALNSQFSAKIESIVHENKEYKTLRLKRPKEWNFLPGQYLEIRSESSSANKPAILAIASGIGEDYIEITAKPNSNPNHPNYCLNSDVGDYLTVTGPLGSNFPLELITPDTPVLLLGGGSGLTALKSLMESMSSHSNAKLIYSSKTSQELIYHEEIEKWKSEGHIISLTQEKTDGYEQGRISEHIKHETLHPNTMIFICGPKELVLETAKMLVEMGIPRESIYGSLPATAKEGGPVYRGDHPKMMIE